MAEEPQSSTRNAVQATFSTPSSASKNDIKGATSLSSSSTLPGDSSSAFAGPSTAASSGVKPDSSVTSTSNRAKAVVMRKASIDEKNETTAEDGLVKKVTGRASEVYRTIERAGEAVSNMQPLELIATTALLIGFFSFFNHAVHTPLASPTFTIHHDVDLDPWIERYGSTTAGGMLYLAWMDGLRAVRAGKGRDRRVDWIEVGANAVVAVGAGAFLLSNSTESWEKTFAYPSLAGAAYKGFKNWVSGRRGEIGTSSTLSLSSQ
ncbi:hypothetical protein JCM8547_008895 [Rhodosporidiobolus lusitaniae]